MVEKRFETFTTQIAKIHRNIRKIKTEEMKEFNLKSPHVSCLYYLYKCGGQLTAKQLCDICEEDKGAISRSLEYLEKEDYLSCNSKKEKRYKSPICLTEKGLKIAKQISKKIDNILESASVGLGDQDRAIFYKSLILISDNLQNLSQSYDKKK